MEGLKKLYNSVIKDKNITNLVIILIIGIIMLIAGGSFFGDSKRKPNVGERPLEESVSLVAQEPKHSYEEALEQRLENILSKIDGVGDVSVMITLYAGRELVPAKDSRVGETITEENDNQGGSRRITEMQKDNQVIIMNAQGGNQHALILKEVEPLVKGVIVAAQGADDVKVRASVHHAVITALGVPAHKVEVFKKK